MNRAFLKYWLPVITWMGLIFLMSTDIFSPESTSLIIEPVLHLVIPEIRPQLVGLIHMLVRKSGHIIEYFIMGLLLYRAFCGQSPQRWQWRWTAATVIVVALCAMSDEFHQSFVVARCACITDVGLDAMGGILSQIAIFALCRRHAMK